MQSMRHPWYWKGSGLHSWISSIQICPSRFRLVTWPILFDWHWAKLMRRTSPTLVLCREILVTLSYDGTCVSQPTIRELFYSILHRMTPTNVAFSVSANSRLVTTIVCQGQLALMQWTLTHSWSWENEVVFAPDFGHARDGVFRMVLHALRHWEPRRLRGCWWDCPRWR